MDKCMRMEARFKTIALVMEIIYALTAVGIIIWAAINKSSYSLGVGAATFIIFPIVFFAYKIFHWRRGYQMEFWIFLFSYLGFTLGGAMEFYTMIPGFDKLVHTLSGAFVSLLALAMYMYLERRRPVSEQHGATAAWFVFFASMAVAGLFELCEFALSPVFSRDLQHVIETGVGDTMTDMLVCLAGTLCFMPLVPRFYRGKYDPLTGAVDAFMRKNNLCGRGGE